MDVILTVDTQQAKAALNAVNEAITQIKLNGSDISIGGQKIAADYKKMGDAAQEAGQKAQRASTNAVKGATRGIQSVTGETTKGLKAIRAFASGCVSWWTALVMAFELAMVTFKYFFNNLTESIPKLIQKTQNYSDVVNKQTEAMKKQRTEAKELMDTLQKLAVKTKLTNVEQAQAQAIIDKLNKKYKNLKVSVDEATGAIIGLKNAQAEINNQNRNQQINELNTQFGAQKGVVDALLKKIDKNLGLDTKLTGDEFFTFAERLFGTFAAQNANVLAAQWNTGDLQKQAKVLSDLITSHSQNQTVVTEGKAVLDALNQLISIYKQRKALLDPNNLIFDTNGNIISATNEVNEAIDKAIEKTKELNKKKQQLDKQNQFNSLDTQQQVDWLKGEARTIKDEVDTMTIQVNAAIEDAMQRADEAKNLTDLSKTLAAEIDQADKDIDAYRRKYNKLTTQIEEKKREKDSTVSNLRAGGQNGLAMQAIDRYNAQIAPLEAELKALSKEKTQAEARRKELYLRLEQVEAARTNSQEQSANAQKEVETLKSQLAAKDIEYINAQDKVIQAEKKLLEEREKIAEKERQEREKKRLQLQQQEDAIKKLFANYQEQEAVAYLKIVGKEKEALMLEARLNAQRAKGAKLTEAELEKLSQYVDRQMLLDDATKNNMYEQTANSIRRGESVITNQLAARGGFASSIVVDRSIDIQQKILKVQQDQKDVLTKLKDIEEKNSIIQ